MSSKALGAVRASTLLRSLAIVVLVGIVLYLASESLDAYRNLQLAYGAYYFCVLAGLTVLAGSSGQISLGQGAFMAVGAYTFAKLNSSPVNWSVFPSLVGAMVATLLVGIPVGAAASRLRGPYLAGATLMLGVALPALASAYQGFLGGDQGLNVVFTAPAFLGATFPLTRWQAWVSTVVALVTLVLLANLCYSRIGRSWRAVRDNEVAAALDGVNVAVTRVLAFVVSAVCAGLAGSLLAIVIVPTYITDVATSHGLSSSVGSNIPIAAYGAVLILVMLAFPQGIQGGLHRLLTLFTGPDERTRTARDGPAPHVTPPADEAPASHHEKEGTL
jgi:branched-chain amino acid transport system permease protein